MRQLPNVLTISRIVLTPVCVYLLLIGRPDLSFPITFITGLTDTADGYFARRLGVETRFGAWMDPVADKVLLTSLYLSFGVVNAVPSWLVWLVVGRDAVILLMVLVGIAFTAIRDFPPTVWGKFSTVLQIAGVLILLSACAGWEIGLRLQSATILAVAAGTAWSGLHYIWRAATMLRGAR